MKSFPRSISRSGAYSRCVFDFQSLLSLTHYLHFLMFALSDIRKRGRERERGRRAYFQKPSRLNGAFRNSFVCRKFYWTLIASFKLANCFSLSLFFFFCANKFQYYDCLSILFAFNSISPSQLKLEKKKNIYVNYILNYIGFNQSN